MSQQIQSSDRPCFEPANFAKDIVKKTIRFESPSQLPYFPRFDVERFEATLEVSEFEELLQIICSAPEYIVLLDYTCPPDWQPQSGREPANPRGSLPKYTRFPVEDEWGVVWVEKNSRVHPLEDGFDWSRLTIPDISIGNRFSEARECIAKKSDSYHLGFAYFTLFERYWLLRGFENALLDPYLHRREFDALMNRILEFQMTVVSGWKSAGADGVFFSDDWGTQNSLLVDPVEWRRIYKPFYARLFEWTHRQGLDIWFHSCGNVLEIVQDLVELGLNVLNPLQPRAMDLCEVARRFRGKLCFFGGLDIQQTLPRGDEEAIRSEIKWLVQTLSSDTGGYIGGTSHTVLPDTPLRNIRVMFEAFDLYCSKT